MILRICNIVEYLVKKRYKVDKKQVVLHVFELLFSDITNDDLQFVSNRIDFLFQHDQIKQVKMISKVALGCGDLITRKFLCTNKFSQEMMAVYLDSKEKEKEKQFNVIFLF